MGEKKEVEENEEAEEDEEESLESMANVLTFEKPTVTTWKALQDGCCHLHSNC